MIPANNKLKSAAMRLKISFPIISLLYLAALAYQISVNCGLVIENRASTHGDLYGFALTTGLTFLMALQRRARNIIRLRQLLYFLCFFIYLAVIASLTADVDLISLFFSSYGIITWLLMGGGTALAIYAIERRVESVGKAAVRWQRVTFIFPLLMLGGTVFSLLGFTINPNMVESYQYAGSNATVLLFTCLVAASRWSSNGGGNIRFMLQVIGILVLGTSLSYMVGMMNSTSIVLVWLLLAAAYLRYAGSRLGYGSGAVLIVMVLFGAVLFFKADIFTEFLEKTRFRGIEGGNYNISSVSSRIDLLPTFFRQFKVAPLIGDYKAEVEAGFFPGDYVHSLPLSLLTHTGIIGFCLFSISLFNLLRRSKVAATINWMSFPRHAFWVLLLVACLTTFFNWLPLWFAIGYFLIREQYRQVSKEPERINESFSSARVT
ncbi:MAG: hypothetical protein JSR26_11940 [Proteobacteria bacterium]|nr:hypothetical protein [Pseudomonadota bacterium]